MPKGTPGRVAATCHPDKPVHGGDLCNNCYARARRQPRERKPPPAPTCHPDRPHRAYGLCYSCYQRDWKVGRRRRDPARRLAYNEKMQGKRYQLSTADLARLREDQGGRCAACGAVAKLEVDHCHRTGVIRGLLCRRCNLALGVADDDLSRLQALIAYLGRTSPATTSAPARL